MLVITINGEEPSQEKITYKHSFAYYSTVGEQSLQENVIYILLGVKDRLSYV